MLAAILRTVGFAGFFLSMVPALICIVRLLDERRGRSIPAGRLLLFPFFLPREGFTERGVRLYVWFLRFWGIGFVFWLICLVSMPFG